MCRLLFIVVSTKILIVSDVVIEIHTIIQPLNLEGIDGSDRGLISIEIQSESDEIMVASTAAIGVVISSDFNQIAMEFYPPTSRIALNSWCRQVKQRRILIEIRIRFGRILSSIESQSDFEQIVVEIQRDCGCKLAKFRWKFDHDPIGLQLRLDHDHFPTMPSNGADAWRQCRAVLRIGVQDNLPRIIFSEDQYRILFLKI